MPKVADWINQRAEILSSKHPSLSISASKFFTTIFAFFILLFVVAVLTVMTYSQIKELFPINEKDVKSAQLRLEIKKLEDESIANYQISSYKSKLEQAKAKTDLDAYKKEKGLPIDGHIDDNLNTLSGLLDIIVNNLIKSFPAIIGIMVATYLLPSFSTTGNPLRLALTLSGFSVCAGIYTLVLGVTSATSFQIKLSEMLLTLNTGSVGLGLITIGTVFGAISIYFLRDSKSEAVSQETAR